MANRTPLLISIAFLLPACVHALGDAPPVVTSDATVDAPDAGFDLSALLDRGAQVGEATEQGAAIEAPASTETATAAAPTEDLTTSGESAPQAPTSETPTFAAPTLESLSEYGERFRVRGAHTPEELCAMLTSVPSTPAESDCIVEEHDGYTFIWGGDFIDIPIYLVTHDGGHTYLSLVTQEDWGVNLEATFDIREVRSVPSHPGRVEIWFDNEGRNHSCTEPSADEWSAQELVVCDLADPAAVRCTRRAVVQDRVFHLRYNVHTDDLASRRLTGNYRLRVVHVDHGIRLRSGRGAVPPYARRGLFQEDGTYGRTFRSVPTH